MERTPLDNETILICSEGTNIYRFVSAKEHYSCCTPSDHVYRKPGGRTIRTLHSVWALHRPTKATASVAHWNSGPFTVLQIQFKKTLKLFHCLSLQDKRTLPPACILTTYVTMGRGGTLSQVKPTPSYRGFSFTCILSVYWTQMSTGLL